MICAASSGGRRRQLEAELRGPIGQRRRQAAAHRCEPVGADDTHFGIARRVQPELELQQQPRVAGFGVVADDPAPHLAEPAVEIRRRLDALREVDDRLADPQLEQGDEQPFLAAEVVVERAGRPVGRRRDRLGRRGVESLPGEQVGGRGQELRSRLRSPLLLRSGHPGTLHRITDICRTGDISLALSASRAAGSDPDLLRDRGAFGDELRVVLVVYTVLDASVRVPAPVECAPQATQYETVGHPSNTDDRNNSHSTQRSESVPRTRPPRLVRVCARARRVHIAMFAGSTPRKLVMIVQMLRKGA